MLNRVKASIAFPEHLIQYRNDGYFKVLLYMTFFAILMATPLIIGIITFNGTSMRFRDSLSEEIELPAVSCAIDDAYLRCDEALSHTLYETSNMQVILNTETTLEASDYSGFNYYFVVHEDSVHVYFLGRVVESRTLASLDSSVHSLDFEDDVLTVTVAMMDAVDDVVVDYKLAWGSVVTIGQVVSNIFIFHAFILINVVLIRGRMRPVGFKQLFVMMTYASTMLFVVLIFDAIYNFNIFLFILLLFVAFRQTNRLAMAILKRISKQ